MYDEVSDDQYRSIVDSRLAQDDFIEDDDGSGYVDNGMDDWGDEEEEESEDEDDFDGEDDELRKGEFPCYLYNAARMSSRCSTKAQTSQVEGKEKGIGSQRG